MREFYPESQRGKSELSWLKSNFSFSFANYYNPNRMNFGTLRVINNDVVAAGTGFGMHPHDNMEIITIALSGSLTHKDSMGNEKTLVPGEVQSMSAGSGVVHSEINQGEIDGEFFQVWIETKQRDIKPQYSQKNFPEEERINSFQLLAGPDIAGKNVLIHQDAFIFRAKILSGNKLTYKKIKTENGIYIMNIFGEVIIGDYTLSYRDALGIQGEDDIIIYASKDADIFVFEVPMV